MNRLTEIDWKSKCEGYPWNVHPVKDIDDLKYYKKLAAYEDAEEQGLLLRLKCKVGDTVYHIVGRIILEVENVDLFFSFAISSRRKILENCISCKRGS